MIKLTTFFALSLVLLLCSSCSRPECDNTNIILNTHSPDTKPYRDELARMIQSIGPDRLTYWLEGYETRANQELLLIRVQGEGLCAKGELQVPDWHDLEGIREKKGMGYRGAQLAGLRFDVVPDSLGARLIYRDLARIVD